MTTREKIIIGLMCLAIFYGAWELIGNRKQTNTTVLQNENPVEQARILISDLSQKVISEKVPDEYQQIINQAGENWSKDPFLLENEALKSQKEAEKVDAPENNVKSRPTFRYSGFLQVGNVKLAIINALEYAVGESLNVDDFYVKSISSQSVVIAQTKGTETVEIPMQDSFPE